MTDPKIAGLSRFRGVSREQCGVIVRTSRGSLTVIPTKNDSPNPAEAYEISVESIRRVHSLLFPGESIVGFLHTHLAHHLLEVSDADWEGAARNPGALHAIYKPSTGEIMWYSYEED